MDIVEKHRLRRIGEVVTTGVDTWDEVVVHFLQCKNSRHGVAGRPEEFVCTTCMKVCQTDNFQALPDYPG